LGTYPNISSLRKILFLKKAVEGLPQENTDDTWKVEKYF